MDQRDPIIYEAGVQGRANIHRLSSDTKLALMMLKEALAKEPWLEHAQVTFDQVKVWDVPPTLDGIYRLPSTELDEFATTENFKSFTCHVNRVKLYVE